MNEASSDVREESRAVWDPPSIIFLPAESPRLASLPDAKRSGTSRVSYSSPLAHPLFTPCSPLASLLLTSCLPLSFPPVFSGNPEKEETSFPFSFCRKVPPLCLPGCRTQTGKRRTSEEGMRLEERERTNADRLEHHRHPHESPFSGFPLKTCGNDRKGDCGNDRRGNCGNDRRGDCGNACPAACPRCLLRLSFPTLVIGNPLL